MFIILPIQKLYSPMRSLLFVFASTSLAFSGIAAGADAAPRPFRATPMPAAAPAATPAPAPAPPAAPAPSTSAEPAKAAPYYGTVHSVNAVGRTFSFMSKAGKQRVFSITNKTKISKDGIIVDFAAVTVGAYVTGQCKKTGEGRADAVSVKIGQKKE